MSQCSKAFFYDGCFCELAPDHEGEHADGYGLHWSDEACAGLDSRVLLHGPFAPLGRPPFEHVHLLDAGRARLGLRDGSRYLIPGEPG